MCKSSNKISCPRCHSQNLYRFGKDKAGNQKYQCKDCRSQFTLEDCTDKKNRVLSYCPVCDSGTYFDHGYKYYSHCTCNSKKCGHSIYVAKPINIPSASWYKKFTPIFPSIANRLSKNLDLSTIDQWYTYETVIFYYMCTHL